MSSDISFLLPAWRIYWRDNTNSMKKYGYHHTGIVSESIDELVESVDDVLRFWPPLRNTTNGTPRYSRLSLLAELGDCLLL